jgi:mono/diheme cytochrome c family protein
VQVVGFRSVLGLVLLLGVVVAGAARADHGGTLQLNGDPAGPYRVSVWTQPTPPRPGPLSVTVAVMRPESFRPIGDVSVELTAESLEPAAGLGPSAVRAVKGPEAWSGYMAELPIPRAGSWKVTVRVEGRDGTGTANFPLDVPRASGGPWLWIAAGGALVLAAGGAWLTRRWRRARAATAVALALAGLVPMLAAQAQEQGARPSRRITMEELHRHGGVPPGWQFGLPAGDRHAGRDVFVKLECHKCHAVQGETFPGVARDAASVGPDLGGMGAHHPAEYFAESILDPNAVVVTGPGFTGPDGRSVMPDYRDTLTVTELIDLVAYIKSLTGGGGHAHPGAPPAREQEAGSYRVRLGYHAHGTQTGHVMVFVTDRETGEPVPYLPVSVTLQARQGAPRRVSLAPMMGTDGFHYGADVSVPPGTTKVAVSIGRPTMRVMPPVAGRFAAPHELSFDWSAAPAPAGAGHGGHKH